MTDYNDLVKQLRADAAVADYLDSAAKAIEDLTARVAALEEGLECIQETEASYKTEIGSLDDSDADGRRHLALHFLNKAARQAAALLKDTAASGEE